MATPATSLEAGSSSAVSSAGVESSLFSSSSTLDITSSAPVQPIQTGPIPSGASSNNSGGGNQFATSTASNLYLYTFLATLVLLLMVSGAVIARSITIRVRARRAIEESIRNGTYVPPMPLLSGSDAAKPVFHDAHIKDVDAGSLVDEKNGRWENLIPIAASFIPSNSPRALPQPVTSALPPRANGSVLSRLRASNLNPFRTVHLQDIIDELASRDLHARLALQQPPQPTQAELAAVAFGAPSTGNEDADQGGIEGPSAVRVAVLIAMPDPAHPTSTSVQDDAHSDSSTSSSSSSPKGKIPAPGRNVAKTNDEEPEMPYVEFGVAEVPLAPAAPRASSLPASSPPAHSASIN